MSRVVHKVACPLPACRIRFVAPAVITPVSLQLQAGVPVMWFERDAKDQPFVEHILVLVPTGQAVPDHAIYVGTVMLQEGTFVLHGYTALVPPFTEVLGGVQ